MLLACCLLKVTVSSQTLSWLLNSASSLTIFITLFSTHHLLSRWNEDSRAMQGDATEDQPVSNEDLLLIKEDRLIFLHTHFEDWILSFGWGSTLFLSDTWLKRSVLSWMRTQPMGVVPEWELKAYPITIFFLKSTTYCIFTASL